MLLELTKPETRLLSDILARERQRLCCDAMLSEMLLEYPHYKNAKKRRDMIIGILERMKDDTLDAYQNT